VFLVPALLCMVAAVGLLIQAMVSKPRLTAFGASGSTARSTDRLTAD
jgi:hypothetical protein